MASFPVVVGTVVSVDDGDIPTGTVIGATSAYNLGVASTNPWVKPGVVTLEILGGKALIAKDRGLLRSGKSDPYVTIFLNGAQVGKTKVISRQLSPTWNHKISVNITNKKNEILLVVKDKDEIGADDPMGECALVLGPEISPDGQRVELDRPLVSSGGCKFSGSLQVACSFRAFTKIEAMQAELDLPKDVVNDLLTLEATDVVVVADDSGSMNTRNENGTTRWDELQTTMRKLLHMLIAVDHHDGFLLKFLNDDSWYTIDCADTLETVLRSMPRPTKTTPLLRNLEPIANGYGQHKDGDTLLFIMTDGIPSDGSIENIQQLLNNRRQGVFVSFLMCTDDDEVVDTYNRCVDPVWGCDITDDYESEKRECQKFGNELNYYKWLAKAILGGKMGRKYDALDEKPHS